MAWQEQTFREVCSRLPAAASVDVFGSAADPSPVDGWSDLDLHLRLPAPVELVGLFGPSVIWAAEIREAPNGQVVRAGLADGRRIDLRVEGGRLLSPALPRDNEVRFLAALAATKLGRGDRLIGTHLVLKLLQACLVQAMLLRDRDQGRPCTEPVARVTASRWRSPASPSSPWRSHRGPTSSTEPLSCTGSGAVNWRLTMSPTGAASRPC